MTKLYTRSCAVCGRHFETFNRFDRLCLEHKHYEYKDPDLKAPYKVYKCAKCARTCSASRIKESGGIEGYCTVCQKWGPVSHSTAPPIPHPKGTDVSDEAYVSTPSGITYNYSLAHMARVKRAKISDEDKEIIKQHGKDLNEWIRKTIKKQEETGVVPCIICKKEYPKDVGTEVFCPDCAKIHVPTLSSGSKQYLPGKASFGPFPVKLSIEKPKQLCPVCSKNLIDKDVKVCEPCRLELIKAPKRGSQKQKPKPGQRKVQYNGRSSDSDK